MFEPATVVMMAMVASGGAGMAAAGAQAVKLGAELYRERQQATGAALKRAYQDVVSEGVPADMLATLDKLEGSK